MQRKSHDFSVAHPAIKRVKSRLNGMATQMKVPETRPDKDGLKFQFFLF